MSRISTSLCGPLMVLLLGGCAASVLAPRILAGDGQLGLYFKNFRNNQGEALIFIYSGPRNFRKMWRRV